MRGPATLLILLGVLFGPAYFLFWERLSGSDGPSFELTERAQRWTLPDGTILHFAKGQAYRPGPVELNPDMNRIGMRLSFESDGGAPGGPGADDYEVTLLQGDQAILQRALRVTGRPGHSVTVDAGTFEVFYPGSYTLLLEGPDAPHTPISRVGVRLRKNVEAPAMPVVWGGMIALVIGLALLIEPYLRRRPPR